MHSNVMMMNIFGLLQCQLTVPDVLFIKAWVTGYHTKGNVTIVSRSMIYKYDNYKQRKTERVRNLKGDLIRTF